MSIRQGTEESSWRAGHRGTQQSIHQLAQQQQQADEEDEDGDELVDVGWVRKCECGGECICL